MSLTILKKKKENIKQTRSIRKLVKYIRIPTEIFICVFPLRIPTEKKQFRCFIKIMKSTRMIGALR